MLAIDVGGCHEMESNPERRMLYTPRIAWKGNLQNDKYVRRDVGMTLGDNTALEI